MSGVETMLSNILSGAGEIRSEMAARKAKAVTWATLLREVHGDIVEDVVFVEVKWMKEYEHCGELIDKLGVPKGRGAW